MGGKCTLYFARYDIQNLVDVSIWSILAALSRLSIFSWGLEREVEINRHYDDEEPCPDDENLMNHNNPPLCVASVKVYTNCVYILY